MTSLYYCAWSSLGIIVGNVGNVGRGGSAHPAHCGVQFHTGLHMLCLSLKPPRRGELVTAAATSGPALSDPLTYDVGSQLSHLLGFDLNHLINRKANKNDGD